MRNQNIEIVPTALLKILLWFSTIKVVPNGTFTVQPKVAK